MARAPVATISGIDYPSEGRTISGIGNAQEADMAPERPGRPQIGPMVNVRLPQDLIEALDRIAEHHGISRAAAIRMILMAELEDPAGGYSGAVGYSTKYVEKARSEMETATWGSKTSRAAGEWIATDERTES